MGGDSFLKDAMDPDVHDDVENHSINVTPFIDVVLVLLIVFMVAAPLATVHTPVDLPPSNASPSPDTTDPLFLTIAPSGTISLGDSPLPEGSLASALDTATSSDHDTRIYIRADKGVDYGQLMSVINRLRDAGYVRIALTGLERRETP